MGDFRIDSEFKALIPSMKAEEYEQLEANVLAEGCRDALVVWGDILIDGHNRYGICKKHGIKFDTVEREFSSREEAKIWIIKNQFGRRNLTDFQRTELAILLKPLVEKQARAATLEGNAKGGTSKSSQNSDSTIQPIRTDETLADLAGVSRDTVPS